MSAVGEADRGMTLLESLVVLAILGLVGSMSVVRFDHALQLYALREATSAVSADLKMARAAAIKSGLSIAFSANSDAATYGWSNATVHTLPDGVSLSTGENGPIFFFPDGSSSGGVATVTNAIANRSISVDALTGNTKEGPL